METYGNSTDPIPVRVTLLRPNPLDASEDQLFLDQLPIPRDAWRYDAHDRVLSWQGAYGGGHLYISHSGLGVTGNIGLVDSPCSVAGGARAQFLCDVALNCGATYESSGGVIVGFLWDPNSQAWKSADWIPKRLLLTYTVTNQGPILPPSFTFEFEDLQTEAIPWDPTDFQASLSLGEHGSQMVWNLAFKSAVAPDPDQGIYPPKGPNSVYPYWMQSIEDAAAATINGVLEIDDVAPRGTLVGMQGLRNTPMAVGYYQVGKHDAVPFGVFDGRLLIDGDPVGNSRLEGDTLYWENLSQDHQSQTGLPEKGSLQFNRDGSVAGSEVDLLTARRLRASSAMHAFSSHSDVRPTLHARSKVLTQALAATQLDIYGLLAMTPFAQNSKGAWGDVVETAVTNDLTDIMNSFIPTAMWNLLFPNTKQPVLSGELAVVANSPVKGVANPIAWYQSLATSVMTSGLAEGSDDNCKYLNGPRANEWLKSQVATSAVYYAHGQMLFQYEWQQRFPLTSQYLADQIKNAGTYATAIDGQVQVSINDINANVVEDQGSVPDLKAKLIAEVQEAGQYAKTNNLYWAFAYFTYNTAPAILANIALQMGINTGSTDGTTLTRLFQQNAAVLTAMDPSGYFANQYTQTLNTFMATNIIPSMFGFLDDATSFDIIKEYLVTWVNQNINNEDKQIAQAAAQIQSILNDAEADKILADSINALRAFSAAIQDTLALPFVAQRFQSWFSTNYPKFSAVSNVFGSLFIGGVTGLAVFSLFSQFKSWSQMTTAQRAQLIINTTQIGLQIIAAVVKRGVRIYSIFNVNGMTGAQRAAAISKVIATGEAEAVEKGMVKIGNTTARWLGDTEGTVGKLAVMDQGVVTAVLINNASSAAEEASWAAKVFGKNLDEFIATRVGPLFILAGIGLSIYFISTGESGVALAADVLNIVGGSLMLFATIGGWAVEGGLIAAEGLMATIISVAGPLAILCALAGIGLMIYEMLQKPPDPVAEFVDDYARPAGLAVSSKDSSIDYAVVYPNADQGKLLMIGFTLSSSGKVLSCNANGSIGLVSKSTNLPDCVWQVGTDGLGMSQIVTIAQPDASKPPVALLLSLMSDNTISFQPQLPPPTPPSLLAKSNAPAPAVVDGPTVKTQTWLSAPQGNAKLTSDGNYLASIPLTFQPVLPDSKGNYNPSQASGWLVQTSSGVAYAASNGTSFTLTMSGMAPNYMRMVDVSFILNSTPSVQQSYGPAFGVYPSTPATYTCPSDTLPSFLTFSGETGTFTPNGQTASTPWQKASNIAIKSALGSANANFNISVAAPPPPPTTLQPA